jgi:hypothetical protein
MVYFGYRSFYKGWPNITRILIRSNEESLAETILEDNYIEEFTGDK